MHSKLKMGLNYVSNDTYHADKEYLSSTPLKLLYDDPAQFYSDVILGNKTVMNSAALDVGSFVHTLILESHLVDKEYAFYPGSRKSGAAYEAFKEANPGKKILNVQTAAAGRAFAASVKARPEAQQFLSGGEAELSICTEINGVKVKMRADYINIEKGFINDIKTTRYPSGASNFKIALEELSYDLSTGLYTMIAEQHFNKKFDFYWTVVSKEDVLTDVYKCSEATMAKGKQEVFEALETYKECMRTGLWVSKKEKEAIDNNTAVNAPYIIQEI